MRRGTGFIDEIRRVQVVANVVQNKVRNKEMHDEKQLFHLEFF